VEQLILAHIVANKKALLAEVHRRQRVVRDYVRVAVHGHTTGL
jgi:hypothetical protein